MSQPVAPASSRDISPYHAALARPGEARLHILDLLRLGLAALVLLSHSYELVDGNRLREPLTRWFHTLSFGDLAVDLFFALSGFLVMRSWQHRPHPRTYLRNRVARIYPGFLAASLISTLALGPFAAAPGVAYWARLDLPAVLVALLLLSRPPTPAVFEGSHYPEVNAPLWTISWEFLCYLSLMALGLAGLLRDRRSVLVLWLLSLAVYVMLRTAALELDATGTFGEAARSAARFAMLVLTGVAFWYFTLHERRQPLLLVAAASLLWLGLHSWLLAEPAVAVAGTYLMLAAAFAPGAFAAKVLPDLSYGTYLYGWPAQKLVLMLLPAAPPALFLLALPLALGCALLSWRLVERPALAWLKAAKGSRPCTAATSAI